MVDNKRESLHTRSAAGYVVGLSLTLSLPCHISLSLPCHLSLSLSLSLSPIIFLSISLSLSLRHARTHNRRVSFSVFFHHCSRAEPPTYFHSTLTPFRQNACPVPVSFFVDLLYLRTVSHFTFEQKNGNVVPPRRINFSS